MVVEFSYPYDPTEETMRSQLVFGALLQVPNRYLLCRVAAKALRKMHRPMTRIEDTTNDVFLRSGNASPIAQQAEVLPVPTTLRAPEEEILMSIPPLWLGLSEEVRV